MLRKQWSGREDSNLRPLPPEDGVPRVTERISGVVCFGVPHMVTFRSVHEHGLGSNRTFGPCLSLPNQAALAMGLEG